jgi:hypothetical protein
MRFLTLQSLPPLLLPAPETVLGLASQPALVLGADVQSAPPPQEEGAGLASAHPSDAAPAEPKQLDVTVQRGGMYLSALMHADGSQRLISTLLSRLYLEPP